MVYYLIRPNGRELEKSSLDPANFSVTSWDYRRTANYGSPHYNKDGTPGQNLHPVTAVRLTGDGKGVFIRALELRPAMQVRLDYSLKAAGGLLSSYAVFTVRDLPKMNFAAHQIDPAVLKVIETELAKEV